MPTDEEIQKQAEWRGRLIQMVETNSGLITALNARAEKAENRIGIVEGQNTFFRGALAMLTFLFGAGVATVAILYLAGS